MTIVIYIVIGLGALVLFVGQIWFLIEAFRSSILWGLAVLFIPFASLVWLFTHWEDAKLPFLVSLGGAFVLVGGFVLSFYYVGANIGNLNVAVSQTPAKATTATIQPQQGNIGKDRSPGYQPDLLAAVNTTKPPIPPAQPAPNNPPPVQNTEPVAPPPDLNESLLLAIQSNDSIQVIQLLNNGANPNETDAVGGTPLLSACRNGNIAIITALISKNANVNCQNKFGATPLILATEGENIEAVSLLLKFGADVTTEDIRGKTPLAIARTRNNSEIIRVLRDAGARK